MDETRDKKSRKHPVKNYIFHCGAPITGQLTSCKTHLRPKWRCVRFR
ncbi:hypothetical protein ACHAXH_001478, partial [Discostella pseudostelligera]